MFSFNASFAQRKDKNMDKKLIREMINDSRTRMHQLIDKRFDELLDSIENGKSILPETEILSLSSPPFLFKGEKPSAVIMNGNIIPTPTWKLVVTTILRACNNEPTMHNRLMELRGSVSGRSRYILSDCPKDMNVPLKIDDDLYFEGKFDSEYLIKMMTERVLKPIGFDYDKIDIVLRPREQKQDMEEISHENEGISIQLM